MRGQGAARWEQAPEKRAVWRPDLNWSPQQTSDQATEDPCVAASACACWRSRQLFKFHVTDLGIFWCVFPPLINTSFVSLSFLWTTSLWQFYKIGIMTGKLISCIPEKCLHWPLYLRDRFPRYGLLGSMLFSQIYEYIDSLSSCIQCCQ